MSEVLVVADHLRGELREVTLELITVARTLGRVSVALIARDPAALAQAVDVEGVSEIVCVKVDADEFENDVYQQALEALMAARKPRVTLLGFNVNAMGYGPAVATRLGFAFASDVFALRHEDETLVAERAFYGGKVHAEVELPGDSALVMLRPTTWPEASGPGSASRSDFVVQGQRSRARHVEFIEPESISDVDIGEADFLLSVGRGVGERESLPQLEELAERMGATLAVSRPLVDAGWVPSSRLVGQSGKTVKPRIYLALGISGAAQHLAGMKASGTVIAVNADPEAAIFGIADYGAVADLFDVAEELEKLY